MRKLTLFAAQAYFFLHHVNGVDAQVPVPPGQNPDDVVVDPGALGFYIPTFSELLTFLIRFFFVLAGLAALFFMLWGALSWVTSGGDKDAVSDARNKIVQAIVGVLLIVAVLAVIWSLENIVFQRTICFGLSCPVTLPPLLRPINTP